MAESVVSLAIERLNDLLIQEAKFLHGVEDQVKDLQTELIRMQCFLEDADAVKDKDKRVSNWVAEVRELAYEAEDLLETFILSKRKSRRGGIRNFGRRFACIFKEGITLHKVGSEIESIKKKITELSASLQTYGIRDLGSGEGSSSANEKLQMLRRTYSHVIEEHFVDFHGDTSKLVKDLVDEEKQFQAISICGIGGLGKTTLAKQVYRHTTVRRHFDGFVWAFVSQQPKEDDILRGILINLRLDEKKRSMRDEDPVRIREEEKEIRKDIVSMRYVELAKEVYETLQKKKCLVVLDDIWSNADWDVIRSAFPPGRKGGSKILLTSRNKDVATYVDSSHVPHEPQLLNEEESWELFQKKISTRGDHTESTITKDQQELGRNMLKRCGGLPLAIVVLGGLLARKHTIDEWKTVNKNINLYLRGDKIFVGQNKGVIEILALSYHDLPYWLKPCFLYLGNYPEDFEILAHTLYQLWIAEGFISLDEERRGKEETLMDMAEHYLGELAQRSMVQVQTAKVEDKQYRDKSFGRFTSCRLHDLMREMCLSMVKEENFLKVIDNGQRSERQSRSSFSSSSSKIHRLAIHGNENIDPSNLCIDQEKNIRGVLFFDGNKCTPWCREEFVSNLPKNFNLARVMHLEEFGSGEEERVELPIAVGDLIHLRYFSLERIRGTFKLPSSIGNLRYLQTLDLSDDLPSSNPIIIPNVLWKLKQLMHLYFPLSWEPVVKDDKLRLDGLDNLEVLDWFDPRFFNVEDLQKLINLRSLTGVWIEGNLQDLEAFVNYLVSITQKQLLLQYSSLRINGIDFCTKDELDLLKQLFFECHPLHRLTIYGRVRELPEYQEGFRSSLTHLSLCNAELKEDPMAILEKLPNLAVLYVWSNAYLGKEMVCSIQGFPCLKKLMLWSLEHLEYWRVDKGAMPDLSYLEIANCSKLKMVPNGLRWITTLQELSIGYMPQAFVNRLKSPDGVDFDKVSHIPSVQFVGVRPDYRDNNEEYQVADNNEEQENTTEGSIE